MNKYKLLPPLVRTEVDLQTEAIFDRFRSTAWVVGVLGVGLFFGGALTAKYTTANPDIVDIATHTADDGAILLLTDAWLAPVVLGAEELYRRRKSSEYIANLSPAAFEIEKINL